MNEAITSGILEIAIALVGLVVAAVVTWVGNAAKKLADSKQVESYTRALREFDQEIWQQSVELGRAISDSAVRKAADFDDSQTYNDLQEMILGFANRYAQKTGVRTDFTQDHLDALIRVAQTEARKAWRRSYGDAAQE